MCGHTSRIGSARLNSFVDTFTIRPAVYRWAAVVHRSFCRVVSRIVNGVYLPSIRFLRSLTHRNEYENYSNIDAAASLWLGPTLLLFTAASLPLPPAIAHNSETNASIFVANNYIFRGLTRTQDQATVQGGVHYRHDIGLYAGLKVSNVDFRPGAGPQGAPLYADTETIYKIGYSNQHKEIAYLIGYTNYEYPSGGGPRFDEFNGEVEYKGFELSLNYDAGNENLYSSISYRADINERMAWLALVGHYDLKNPDALTFKTVPDFDDYTHVLLGFDYRMDNGFIWGFNYSRTSLETDTTDEYGRFIISLSKSFTLFGK